MEDTKKLKKSDQAIYHEGCEILRTEAAEDDAVRRKYGTDRWNRPTAEAAAPKLYAQIGEIDGYFKAAVNSDNIVKTKLKENERNIQLLSGPDRDLENFVPSGRRPTTNAVVDREAGKLRGCLNEVSRLESRRRRKIEALRMKAKLDDINPDLLQEAARLEREYPMQSIEAVQFEDLFDKRLQMYNVDKEMVQDEERQQQDAIKRLQEANAAFVIARKGDQSTKQREQALQSLENSFFKYKEIISNLDVGRKFYNDLAKIVSRFRDDCRTFAYQRKAEASQLENDIATAMSSLNLQASSLQQQRHAESQNPQYGAAVHAEEPLTAPTPTRAVGPTTGMWTPEVGIRFGGAAPATLARSRPEAGAPQDGRWDAAKGLKFG